LKMILPRQQVLLVNVPRIDMSRTFVGDWIHQLRRLRLPALGVKTWFQLATNHGPWVHAK
jgi:hypothetical protein